MGQPFFVCLVEGDSCALPAHVAFGSWMIFVGPNLEDFVPFRLHLQAAVVIAEHAGRFLPFRHGNLLLWTSVLYTTKRKAASSNRVSYREREKSGRFNPIAQPLRTLYSPTPFQTVTWRRR